MIFLSKLHSQELKLNIMGDQGFFMHYVHSQIEYEVFILRLIFTIQDL